MHIIKKLFLILPSIFVISCNPQRIDDMESSVIPVPYEMVLHSGRLLADEAMTLFSVPEFHLVSEFMKSAFPGIRFEETGMEQDAFVRFMSDSTVLKGAYILDVSQYGITVSSSDYSGIASSIATLRQLASEDEPTTFPCIHIEDYPRFQWRGVHLDVARHFYTKNEVMRLLDLMSFYKMNKFHWHLTDDQGWRIQIDKYPLLTEKGAWRKLNGQDLECREKVESLHNPDFSIPESLIHRNENGEEIYGGFYTKEDIREIVHYAAVRGIDIIPEIDMPGHIMAAIDQYPYLTCPGHKGWGELFTSPLCVGNDDAIQFCKNVWGEVFELFPYEYVHLGADEVDKRNWKICPMCQSRLRNEGLEETKDLQAWYVREMENFFNAQGKHMMGWDEVLEDGLTDHAVISWWRAWNQNAVQTATARGQQVVMCPNSYLYFDYPQGPGNVSDIYNREPMPEGLTPEQEKMVLGIQCNIWTEVIPSVDRMDYMLFPRLLAVSELAWRQPDAVKDWPGFEKRVMSQLHRLERMGVNYRIPDLTGFAPENIYVDTTWLDVKCPLDGIDIRYTEDSSIPTLESATYDGPIMVSGDRDFTLRTFRKNGTPGDIFKASFRKGEYHDSMTAPQELSAGLNADWYAYEGDRCDEIENAPHVSSFTAVNVGIPVEVKGKIGLIFNGYIEVPEDAIYTFSLNSDDGSRMLIDGEAVIDNDGYHSPIEKAGQVALRKGLHEFRLSYFDPNGGLLELFLVENGVKKPIPDIWFRHQNQKKTEN